MILFSRSLKNHELTKLKNCPCPTTVQLSYKQKVLLHGTINRRPRVLEDYEVTHYVHCWLVQTLAVGWCGLTSFLVCFENREVVSRVHSDVHYHQPTSYAVKSVEWSLHRRNRCRGGARTMREGSRRCKAWMGQSYILVLSLRQTTLSKLF